MLIVQRGATQMTISRLADFSYVFEGESLELCFLSKKGTCSIQNRIGYARRLPCLLEIRLS